jgi:hypothetical protein
MLTNRCAATAVRTLPIKDSDHRALLAHVQLPK